VEVEVLPVDAPYARDRYLHNEKLISVVCEHITVQKPVVPIPAS
jgi:hypothetical protein